MKFSPDEIRLARRIECEADGLYFARYFFHQRYQFKMIIARFHQVMQQALDRTMLPVEHPEYINRLIVNIPPGYGKTDMCVINYIARGIAINRAARFLHLSFSEKLVLNNSSVAREIINNPEYQAMWPTVIKDDTDSKAMWYTHEGGGVNARPTKGQVTGFRAGHMNAERFTGALLIDDPLKPDDANYPKLREAVNNRYEETVASRLAVESVPIIVVMQRIHFDDLSGFLLRGGSGEYWHHLNLPVIVDNGEEYPEEYTHGVPLEHGLDNGWLWEVKHNDEHLVALQSHRRRFAAQYMQKPLKRDEFTALWTEETLKNCRALRFNELYEPLRTVVAVDPATTNTEASDEHGITVATKYAKNMYSVDGDYTRKGSPLTWAKTVIYAVEKHGADCVVIETNQGGDMVEQNLRNAGYRGRIKRVHAKKNKTLRAEPVVALYEQGYVQHLVGHGLSKLETEQLDFDPEEQKSNGKSPNRVDSVVYALSELAGIGTELSEMLDIAMGR